MIYQIEARFHQFLESHDPASELDARLLTQMARESLLLQASDWQFLITTASAADYATERFRGHYDNALFLAGCIETVRRGEALDPGSAEKVAELERTNRLFPDLRLDHWRAGAAVAG